MFLRAKKRIKDGKVHRYWSIVESYRIDEERVLQRQVLYLGEINDSQHAAWCRAIDVLHEGSDTPEPLALFPDDRPVHQEIYAAKRKWHPVFPSDRRGACLSGRKEPMRQSQ